MSSVTFSENHEGKFIAFEEEKALASLVDPREEALKWIYSLGAFPSQHVVVIGLGSGFHIAALVEFDPSIHITVVESREALVSMFKKQFPEIQDRVEILLAADKQELLSSEVFAQIVEERSYVLSFRECWGKQINLFTEYFAHLTGRTVDSVSFLLKEFHINMKALYLQPSQSCRNLLTIKDVMPVIEASYMPENKKQMFRTLAELVK